MWIWVVIGAGLLALFGYAAMTDLRARRRGQRLHVSSGEVRDRQLADRAEFDRYTGGDTGAGGF